MRKNNVVNRIMTISCAISCSLAMIGCGIESAPYTDEEIDKIGEYAALMIAGNDPDASRLVDVEDGDGSDAEKAEDAEPEENEIEEEPAEPEDQNDSGSGTTDVEIVDVSVDNNTEVNSIGLEEFLQFAPGVYMTYNGYEWKESLTNQSGSYFYDPESGNYFLVVYYTIYNGSGETQDIDFLYAGYSFNLRINDEKTIVAHEIPINEDLPTYIGRLANGTGVNLMITFECDSNYFNNIQSMKLTIKNTTDSCSVVLE